MGGVSEADLRDDLAAAFRAVALFGLNEAIGNHLTARLMDPARILINPLGLHFAEMTGADLVVMDESGRLEDPGIPVEPTGLVIHAAVHRRRPDAGCVIHTHMPHATALTLIRGGRLLPLQQVSLRFFENVAYDDDAAYGGLALGTQEGERIAAALGDKSVLLLRNHGVIVVGATIARAFDNLYYLERSARVQLLAMASGVPLDPVPDDVARAARRQIEDKLDDDARLHFAAIKRLTQAPASRLAGRDFASPQSWQP